KSTVVKAAPGSTSRQAIFTAGRNLKMQAKMNALMTKVAAKEITSITTGASSGSTSAICSEKPRTRALSVKVMISRKPRPITKEKESRRETRKWTTEFLGFGSISQMR